MIGGYRAAQNIRTEDACNRVNGIRGSLPGTTRSLAQAGQGHLGASQAHAVRAWLAGRTP
jgi:hypothetical protein